MSASQGHHARKCQHLRRKVEDILGQQIWSLDEHLAKPLVGILCGQHTEEELLDLIRSEDQMLQAELVLAKAVYKAYLQRNRLIAVELDLSDDQHQ